MRRLRRSVSGVRPAAGLSAFVDVLTLMLLFLLRAWSSDPPPGALEADFALARSTSEDPAPRALALDVGEEAIAMDGVRLTRTGWYAEHEEVRVVEVLDVMRRHQPDRVALRVDADVSWVVVRKLLFTLREAGVEQVDLIAASRAGL